VVYEHHYGQPNEIGGAGKIHTKELALIFFRRFGKLHGERLCGSSLSWMMDE
jgi:hypothetical protein